MTFKFPKISQKTVKNENFKNGKKVPLDNLEIHIVYKFEPSRLKIKHCTLMDRRQPDWRPFLPSFSFWMRWITCTYLVIPYWSVIRENDPSLYYLWCNGGLEEALAGGSGGGVGVGLTEGTDPSHLPSASHSHRNHHLQPSSNPLLFKKPYIKIILLNAVEDIVNINFCPFPSTFWRKPLAKL